MQADSLRHITGWQPALQCGASRPAGTG